ncbi:MAG: thiamine pyrophosphate-binding protein [Gammaproteobacteria bacterium]|nr:thiamine pyrophosphate-binding protein [Gammaproteobacteria bacterium]
MTTTVSEYILARLKSLGVDHVFGIPGDFILPFFRSLENSDVEHVDSWDASEAFTLMSETLRNH